MTQMPLSRRACTLVISGIWSLGSPQPLPVCVILNGVPLGIFYWLDADSNSLLYALPLFPLLPAIGMWLFGIRKVYIEEEGLRLQRIVGNPRFVSWEAVTGVRMAERSEIALAHLSSPHRICLRSASFREHVYISFDDGWFCFPPKDVPLFLELISPYLADKSAVVTIDSELET